MEKRVDIHQLSETVLFVRSRWKKKKVRKAKAASLRRREHQKKRKVMQPWIPLATEKGRGRRLSSQYAGGGKRDS